MSQAGKTPWEVRLLAFLSPPWRDSIPVGWRYVLAALLAAAGILLRWVLIPKIGIIGPYIIGLPVVVLATLLFGTGPGMLSIGLTLAGVEVFLLGPHAAALQGHASLRIGLTAAIVLGTLALIQALRGAQVLAHQAEEEVRWMNRHLEEHVQERTTELRRLARAVEQAAEIVVITDVAGEIVYVNEAFVRTTGYTREEALGRNPRILKSGQHDRAFYADLWDTILRGEAWHGQITNRRKDGTLFIEDTTISPVRNPAGELVNFVADKRDITRERQLEEQVRQAQKMEAIGRLAGGVAHDFNNLLQGILGFCDVMLLRWPEEDPRKTDLLQIQRAARRAADLTRQLLAFSRRQMLLPRVADLNRIVSGTERMFRRLLGEDIRLDLDLAEGPLRVRADEGQLEQVLLNLMVNARDAMPGGGRILVRTREARLEAGAAEAIPEARAGAFAVLEVADAGQGMSREVLERIFEPFFSTKGPGKGTGLGLAVIYGIIQQHQGWVNVESTLGQGSTFRLWLPLSELPESPEGAEPSVPWEPQPACRATILLVEDEPVLRHLSVRVLGDAGYDLLAVGKASEALAILQAEPPREVHLLFSDVGLPDLNGLQLAEQVQRVRPELPVLLCSGYSDERSREIACLEKGFGFLQKPYSNVELLGMVQAMLAVRP